MQTVAYPLIRAFGDDHSKFHKKHGCVQMFIRISEQVDKTSGLPLAKFVAKAISFGFDRAIYDRNCN
jgi:hypothetical protein